MASPLQKQVYQAYLEAGLSPNQARIITAEVGRENSFNPQNIFGVHSDPKNGAANLGMLSWQGDRGNALYKDLRSKGMIKNNQITPTQDALNQMARFSVNEMRTNKNYQQTAKAFLNNPDVDYQTGSAVLGRNYIRWRYDDPQYQSGHKNRDKFYQAMGGNMTQQRATMNDLHSLFQGGVKVQKVNSTGRQLRQGFASDIPPELRNTAPIPQGKKVASNGDNIASMNDLHSLFVAQKQASYQPFDNSKEARQKREQAALKGQDKTQFWESGLLGLADIGVPFVQGAQYVKDKLSQGVNAVAGTNLPTNSYEGVTRTYKDINDAHNTVRKANNQGIDVGRIGANIVATAPLAGAGGTLKAGTALASKAGAQFLGRNAAVGGLIGASGVHENNTQRLQGMAAGALGGALGAGVGQKVGEGVNSAVRKLTPSTASTQNIDIVIDMALKNSSDDSIRGMSVTDLSQPARDGLRNEIKKVLKQGKAVDNKTVERMAVFHELKAKGVNLKPTGKQATGNPKLWTKETELSKMDGGDALNNRYIQQNETLINALDDATTATNGTSTSRLQTGESVLSALNTGNSARQQVIKDLYNVAKNHTGNDLTLDPNAVVQNARRSMVDNFINPDKAQTSLLAKLKPFMDEENPKAFTLKDKELFVKQINSAIGKTTDGETRAALGLVRNALEEEADNALNQFGGSLQGEAKNAWQSARSAASQRFKQVERTPALKAAIDDVAPDLFFEKFILSKSSALRDVEGLAKEIKDSPEAFNNIRLEILRYISDSAVTKQGQAISPAGMNRALQAIGDDKLKLFFDADELKHLKNLNAASRYLYSQPMGSNVNNSNTSSALINMIGYMDVLKRIPVVGPKLDSISKGAINGVNAQIKISQGGNAISKTATKQAPSAANQSLIDRLTQMGLIGGANLPEPQ